MEMLIKGGRVWYGSSLKEVDIAVSNGVITEVGDSLSANSKTKVIDAKGMIVLPGGIDVHTHCEDGTVEERADFYHMTKACAKSGITSVFVMPTPGILVNSMQRFNERVDYIKDKAFVDYGLIGGAGSDNLDRIKEQAEAGVIAFKTFCCNPDWEGEDTEGCCSFNNGSLIDIMKAVKETGVMHMLHVQDLSIADHIIDAMTKEGRNDVDAFIEAQPPIIESSGVATALSIAKFVDAPIHFCHISYKDSLDMIRQAKKENQDVSCEVLTCNLELTRSAIYDQFPYILWYPLPGTEEDKDAIYQGINDGTVDMVNSDHSPFTKEELHDSIKESIFNALPGGTNLEVTLPLLLDKVNKGILTMDQLVDQFMVNPAKRFNLYPKKGVIEVGSDADLVIVDMDYEKTFTEGQHDVKVNYTQFDGMTLKGHPVKTILRGQLIVDDFEMKVEPGCGSLLRPMK